MGRFSYNKIYHTVPLFRILQNVYFNMDELLLSINSKGQLIQQLIRSQWNRYSSNLSYSHNISWQYSSAGKPALSCSCYRHKLNIKTQQHRKSVLNNYCHSTGEPEISLEKMGSPESSADYKPSSERSDAGALFSSSMALFWNKQIRKIFYSFSH